MDITTLTEKAMILRQRFGEAARQHGRREWSREEVMQGFVVDVGDLMKLVMAKSGVREVSGAEQKLAHELADCLWSVLVLAKLYEIDIESAFLAMTESVSEKLERPTALPSAQSFG
jgi:NTP pyrophosphatase (non-canonical NTP hydrolase)